MIRAGIAPDAGGLLIEEDKMTNKPHLDPEGLRSAVRAIMDYEELTVSTVKAVITAYLTATAPVAMEGIAAEREACIATVNRFDKGGDCEHNRGTEPDTGAGICSLESRDGYCICGEVNDTLLKVMQAIRARAALSADLRTPASVGADTADLREQLQNKDRTLEREAKGWSDQVADLTARLEAEHAAHVECRDKLETLVKAAEPFAKRAEFLDGTEDAVTHWHPAVGSPVSAGDLRRLRAALAADLRTPAIAQEPPHDH